MVGYLGFFREFPNRPARRVAERPRAGVLPGTFRWQARRLIYQKSDGSASHPYLSEREGMSNAQSARQRPSKRIGSNCLALRGVGDEPEAAGVILFTAACQAGVAKRIGWSRPYLGGSRVHTNKAVLTVFVAFSAVVFALRMMAMSSSVVPCSAQRPVPLTPVTPLAAR